MMRALFKRLNEYASTPTVISVAAGLATVGYLLLHGAIEGAKGELEKLDEQLAARSNELRDTLDLLHQAAAAQGDERATGAVLAVAGERGLYPGKDDVDPLHRAEA